MKMNCNLILILIMATEICTGQYSLHNKTGSCADISPNCGTNTYQCHTAYVQVNCEKTCGLCDETEMDENWCKYIDITKCNGDLRKLCPIMCGAVNIVPTKATVYTVRPILSDECYECKDNHDSCSRWAMYGACQKNPEYMLENCKLSCGACDMMHNECKDNSYSCSRWAMYGECQKRPEYMLENCKLSCDACDTTFAIGGVQAGGEQAGGAQAIGAQAGGTQAGGAQAFSAQAGGSQAGGAQAGDPETHFCSAAEQDCEKFCTTKGGRLCPNSRRCFFTDELCNGKKDCQDGSDELGCGPDTCVDITGDRSLSCGDGSTKCIENYFRCDGERNCPNRGDERDCGAYCDLFKARRLCPGSTICLPFSRWCDGNDDCPGATDEQRCGKDECQSITGGVRPISCGGDTLGCFNDDDICDGYKQCGNNADEQNCGVYCTSIGGFLCPGSNTTCVRKEQRCDGIIDCFDDEDNDEDNCATDTCMSLTNNRDYFCGADETRCIKQNEKCNGEEMCSDGQDEKGCRQCSGDTFLCTDGSCIPDSRVCDNSFIPGCPDNSDEGLGDQCEFYCEKRGERLCPGTSTCISNSDLCNGIKDCPDGWDEQRCGPDECKATTGNRGLSCGNCSTVCIKDSDRCSFYAECPDGSDEINCDGKFNCGDGTFIDNTLVCDHNDNCRTRLDESNCDFELFIDDEDCDLTGDQADCPPPTNLGGRSLHPCGNCYVYRQNNRGTGCVRDWSRPCFRSRN